MAQQPTKIFTTVVITTVKLFESLIQVVAPHTCIGCGNEGTLLCDWCYPDVLLPVPSRCYRCNTLTDNNEVCAKCRVHTPLRHVWIASEYDGLPRQLLSRLKFGRTRAASSPIGRLMADSMPYLPDTVIVPVPTATSRVRQRGYDQTQLIAKQVSSAAKVPVVAALSRLGQARQTGAKREQRLHQLRDAFYVRNPAHIKGKTILLVDDVITTGATLETAATVLKKAGAKRVDAVVFAQRLLN